MKKIFICIFWMFVVFGACLVVESCGSCSSDSSKLVAKEEVHRGSDHTIPKKFVCQRCRKTKVRLGSTSKHVCSKCGNYDHGSYE